MIGKATTIPYGFNDLSYIRGESANKKHPEKIFFVKNNLLDNALDSEGIYDAMKSRCEDHPLEAYSRQLAAKGIKGLLDVRGQLPIVSLFTYALPCVWDKICNFAG